MALDIASLDVTCRVSPRDRPLASAAGEWLRERLAARLGEHLGPSLERLGGLTVLRALHVRVRVRGGEDLSANALLDACSRAFGESLFRALAEGGGGDETLRRFADALDLRAARIRWLLSLDPEDRWLFAEDPSAGVVSDVPCASAAEATLAEVLGARAEILTLLTRLRSAGALERLLRLWDDYAIERLIIEQDRHAGGVRGDPALLLRVAHAAVSVAVPPGRRFGSRHHLVAVCAAGGLRGVSMRAANEALAAIRLLLEHPAAVADPRRALASIEVAPAVLALLEAQARQVTASRTIAAIERLRSLAADLVPPVRSATATVIGSRFAGAALLLPMIRASGWLDALAMRPPRWSSAIVAGILHAAVDTFDSTDPSLDPGVSLLAGVGADPSAPLVRQLFADAADEERVDLARLFGESEQLPWSALLAAVAVRLTMELGARVRGFRRAPAGTIADRFLRREGTITARRESVTVSLSPNPWNVALSVSGFVGEIAAPRWLDHRPVILELEGL